MVGAGHLFTVLYVVPFPRVGLIVTNIQASKSQIFMTADYDYGGLFSIVTVFLVVMGCNQQWRQSTSDE